MPVTGSGTRVIFCEGKPESLDFALVRRLVPSGWLIRPAGGKRGFNAFIEGYLSGLSQEPSYVAFRDRDFDEKPPGDQRLIPTEGAKPIYLSFRACLESYVLDPGLLHDYWTYACGGPSWEYGLSPGVDALRHSLTEAAKEVADYQALRWALADLKPGARWPEVRTTWMKKSGDLPASLDWDACLSAARESVEDYRRQAGDVTEDKLETTADQYRASFRHESFFAKEEYLVWFHGKDLLTQWRRRLDLGKAVVDAFCEWALNRLDYERHPDLEELARLCAKL